MGALLPPRLSLVLLALAAAGASAVPPQPASGGAPPGRCLATEGFLFPGRAFPLNQAAYAVVSGDFDRDGRLDLAVSLAGSPGSVVILLGERAGGFRRGASYPVQDWPLGLATADLNGDGMLDLIAASSANARPQVPSQVLLGKGDGTFQPPRDIDMGSGAPAVAVAVADFDGDRRPDLAFALDSGSLALRSGRGDGTFAPAKPLPAGERPTGFATADLNGDKRPDLAMIDAKGLTVLLNQGDGLWGRVHFPAAGARALSVADWDGDGALDLAIATGGLYEKPSELLILLNSGDGSFPSKMSFRLPQRVWALAAADLDGDGRTDLVVSLGGDDPAPGMSSGDLAVFRNLGHGLFAEPRLSATGALALALTVGSFDGSGRPGVAAVGPLGMIFLVRNEGGRLEGQTRVTLPSTEVSEWTGVPGDFNGDGHTDLATVSHGGQLALFLDRGDRSFQAMVQQLAGMWSWVDQSDLNGDRRLDLVLVGPLGIEVLLGRGNGTFAPSMPVLGAGRPTPELTALVDLQGDGRKDLAVIDSSEDSTGEEATLRVFLGQADGTFTPPRIQKIGHAPTAMVAVDLDGAGHRALVMTDTAEGDLLLARWANDSIVVSPVLRQQRRTRALAAGDVNGDGRADLLMIPAEQADAQLLLGDGQGHFSPGPSVPASSMPRVPSLVDMDGDGQVDLVGPAGDGTWMFVRGLGGAHFAPPQAFATGAGVPRLLGLADFDHSGRLGVALATGFGRGLKVLAPARCQSSGPPR